MALDFILTALEKIHQRLDRIETMPIWGAIGVLPVANGGTGGSSLASAGIVSGGGAANRLALWSDASSLSSDADAMFDGQQLALAAAGSTGGVLLGGDVQIYRGAADVLQTPDNIAQGSNPNTANDKYRFSAVNSETHASGALSRYGSYVSEKQQVNTGATSLTQSGLFAEVYQNIAGSLSNAGSIFGLAGNGLRNSIAGATVQDNGTLANLYGNYFTYGHSNMDAAATPTTTAAYGTYIRRYSRTGLIATAYDLYLASPVTGGSVTNAWALYSANNAKSYMAGGLLLGTTSSGSGAAAPQLVIAQTSGSPGTVSNAAGLFTRDSATAELWCFDEAGNQTQLSKHADPDDAAQHGLIVPDDDPYPQVSCEENVYLGVTAYAYRHYKTNVQQRITVDWPPERRRDWDADQAYNAAERAAQQTAWDAANAQYQAAVFEWAAENPETRGPEPQAPGQRPADYTYKPMPAWMARRLAAKRAAGK